MILASTVHDPENRLAGKLRAWLPKLLAIYRSVVIICSPESGRSMKAIARLKSRKLTVGTAPYKTIFATALKQALRASSPSSTELIHYCDLDRAIHWVSRFPSELKGIERMAQADYVILGRTPRAYKTHPEVQQLTEQAINGVASALLGRKVDVSAGSALLHRPMASKLSKLALTPWAGWWLVAGNAGSIGYIMVEGLEWETPDRYEKEIKAQGFAKWLSAFEAVDARKRAMFAATSVDEMLGLAQKHGQLSGLNKI